MSISRQAMVLLMAIAMVSLLLAGVVWAADDAASSEAGVPKDPLRILASVVLYALLVASIGCALAVVRIIFPGPARLADEAAKRLHTWRLLLTGLLPIVGAGLLGFAAKQSGVEALTVVWAIVIALPVAILSLIGATAAVPHLGAGVLKGGEDHSLLARSITGALVLGFALGAVALVFPKLAPLPGVVVAGWFLGAGLGVVFRTRPEVRTDETP